ncbi:MAG: hypothetical protein ACQESN_10660 [Thermotogota bacterium]
MGEKIKTLSKSKINGLLVEIELNEPNDAKSDDQVHIEWRKHRLELSKKEFVKYGLAILIAEKNLKYLKDIK